MKINISLIDFLFRKIPINNITCGKYIVINLSKSELSSFNSVCKNPYRIFEVTIYNNDIKE